MPLYLDSIRPRAPFTAEMGFPFTLPLVRDMGALGFTAPATFFVGENGSGKSTLLEAIATGLKAWRPIPQAGRWRSAGAQRDAVHTVCRLRVTPATGRASCR